MSRVVFFLEDKSAAILLEIMIPRLFPSLDFICLKHERKNDLEHFPIKRKMLSPCFGEQLYPIRLNLRFNLIGCCSREEPYPEAPRLDRTGRPLRCIA